jgi:hypothetical protein
MLKRYKRRQNMIRLPFLKIKTTCRISEELEESRFGEWEEQRNNL